MSPVPRLDPGVLRPRHDLLVGGAPLRFLRLSPAGARALDALLAGTPAPGVAALQARLLAAGLLLLPPGPGRAADVTVVVPVLDSTDQVRSVRSGVPAGTRVVLVDDGSPQPLCVPGVEVVRHARTAGPAAARNTGAALVTTPVVAFVDDGITLPPGALERLAGHFVDERVVAVAPRIASDPAPGLAGVLEQQLSSLDLGRVAGEVRPGQRLSYVPSAVLLVRRSAFEQVGGFDESLRVGEDVDLVWRLSRSGVVRYDPDVVVRHAARPTLAAVLRRRADYGSSAAPLDQRHPGRVRHLVLSPWFALPWVAALLHPAAAPVVAGVLVARAPRALPALPPEVARRLVGRGQWEAFTAVGRYSVRPALPATLVAVSLLPRVRRLLPLLGWAYAAAVLPDLRRGPLVGALRLLDDVAYSTGVWRGCVRGRRWRPLVPGWSAAGARLDPV